MEKLGVAPLLFYILTRLGMFGQTRIRIPLDEQGKTNSYGKNWFSAETGWLYNEVVEYEDWPMGVGQQLRVGTYGWSMKPIKIIYD